MKNELQRSASDQQLEQWSGTVVGLTLLAIALLTLYPYDFFILETLADLSWPELLARSQRPGLMPKELVANVLLFMPFGFGWAQLIQVRSQPSSWQRFRQVLGASLVVTLAVEFLQIFLPSRNPSYIDVITNTMGGALGYGVWVLISALCAHYRPFFHLGLSRSQRLGQRIGQWLGLLMLVTYCVWALSGSASLRESAALWNLDSWDPTYPLIVGNELTGDRPWSGTVGSIQFYPQPLTEGIIGTLLGEPDSSDDQVIEPRPLAHYTFAGTAPFADISGNLPPLTRQPTEATAQAVPENFDAGNAAGDRPQGISVGPQNWLQSTTPPAALTQALRDSQAFTLSLAFTSTSPSQNGPARIFSLSKDPQNRNLTVGQEKRHLSLRLRTAITQGNGHRPEFIIPNVFSSANVAHHLVIRYDSHFLVAYLDSLANRYQIQLSPETTFFWQRSPSFGSSVHLSSSITVLYRCLYRALFAVPLGIFAALATPPWPKSKQRFLIFFAGVVLPCGLLEWTLGSSFRIMAEGYWLVSIGVGALIWLSYTYCSTSFLPLSTYDSP